MGATLGQNPAYRLSAHVYRCAERKGGRFAEGICAIMKDTRFHIGPNIRAAGIQPRNFCSVSLLTLPAPWLKGRLQHSTKA